jgi:hypothetical protein
MPSRRRGHYDLGDARIVEVLAVLIECGLLGRGSPIAAAFCGQTRPVAP